MQTNEVRQKQFVGYEYKELTAESSQASFLIDGYENFGWELDENLLERSSAKYTAGKKVVIRLKRNRKIVNKAELTRLQRNFEACVEDIKSLEKSRTSQATAYALILAVIGTVFMGGSTFAVTAQPPHIALCIVLAVPGFLGWIFPYFLYRRILRKRTEEVAPLIEEKYEEIYELCEKGNRLLV